MTTRILIDSGPSRRGFSRVSTFLRCPQHFVYRGYARTDPAGRSLFEEAERVLVPEDGGMAELEAAAAEGPHSPPLVKGGIIHTAVAHLYAQLGAAQGGVVVGLECLPDDLRVGETGVILDVLGNVVPGIAICGRTDLLVTDPGHFYSPEEAIEQWCIRRPEGERYRALAENCVRGYARTYRDDGERMRIVAVERQHSLGGDALGTLDMPGHPAHGTPLEFTARIDYEFQVWDGASGRPLERGASIFYGDHKTTGRVTSKAREYYTLHGQFTGYRVMGQREWGPRFAGVQLNLIETSGDAFARPPLDPSPGWTGAFLGRIRRAEHDIARLELETMQGKLDPYEWPGAIQELVCFHRYGGCDSAKQCRFGGPS